MKTDRKYVQECQLRPIYAHKKLTLRCGEQNADLRGLFSRKEFPVSTTLTVIFRDWILSVQFPSWEENYSTNQQYVSLFSEQQQSSALVCIDYKYQPISFVSSFESKGRKSTSLDCIFERMCQECIRILLWCQFKTLSNCFLYLFFCDLVLNVL